MTMVMISQFLPGLTVGRGDWHQGFPHDDARDAAHIAHHDDDSDADI